MNQHFSKSAAWAFCVSVLLPAAAVANPVFSNFGPAQGYNTLNGSPVGNAFDGNNYAEGATFTPSANAIFGSLDIALSWAFSAPASSFIVDLTQNNGGQPGAVIESFTVSGGLLQQQGNNNAPLALNSVLHPSLLAGTAYWITVATANARDSIVWNDNSTGDVSNQAVSTDGAATWFAPSGGTPGAYEINSYTAVPEPFSYITEAFILLPLLMNGLKQSRKTRAA